MSRIAIALVLLAATSLPAVAQPAPAPGSSSSQDAPKPAPAPDAATPAPAATSETDGKTVSNPNLQVASVKLEDGYRASKVIGAAVYNDQNQQIGSVDDIILNPQNQAVLAVVSVGGFLGVGGKLIAMPYGDLKRDDGKIMMPHADKNSLASMPSFTFGP